LVETKQHTITPIVRKKIKNVTTTSHSGEKLPPIISPPQTNVETKTPKNISPPIIAGEKQSPNPSIISPDKESTTPNDETSAERTERILREAGIKTNKDIDKEEAELWLKEMQADLLEMRENPVEIKDNYDNIPF